MQISRAGKKLNKQQQASQTKEGYRHRPDEINQKISALNSSHCQKKEMDESNRELLTLLRTISGED